MEFLVLGGLEVWGEQRLPPLRPRQERLLARLLQSPDRVVSIGALAEALWDGEPPDSAERQVQNAASQLRQAWLAAGVADAREIIRTVRAGYRLAISVEQTDLARYRALVARAAVTHETGDIAGAIGVLREALALWRGPAFSGIKSAVIEANAALLNEERAAGWEECMRLELQAGRHNRVVTELGHLVSEFPFREELNGLLMIALYRTGRQKEALDAYQEIRARLGDELGIDPGPELKRLHQRILQNDPTLVAPAPPAALPARPPVAINQPSVPRQIPPQDGYFAGRMAELEQLSRDSGHVQVLAVTGAAGMGKTSLVVQWCHQVRPAFPDGQIFLDLQGHHPVTTRSPASVLAHILESLQLPPSQVPNELEQRITLYRSLTSERRILIILDNAGSIDQVLPAIPAGAGSQLVVTSRSRLAALYTHVAVSGLTLGPLGPQESRSILSDQAGRWTGIRDDPALERLVDLCSGMPLALRIVAARIQSEPLLTLDDLVAELSAGEAPLDGLAIDGDTRSVRSVLASAYTALSADDGRTLRLLAVHPGARFRLELVAAAAGVPLPVAKHSLENLVATHLVNDLGDRYFALHDLVRSFAEERLNRSAAQDRPGEASDRHLAWYLAVAREANRILRPDRDAYAHTGPVTDTNVGPFLDKIDAITFMDQERENLAPVTALAIGRDVDRAIQLIYNLHSYLVRSGFPAAVVEVWKSCVDRSGDGTEPRTLAHLHHALGGALGVTNELDLALDHLNRSAELYEASGDPAGAAGARLGIAWVLQAKEKFSDALIENERALALAQAAGNGTLAVHALNNSANTLVDLGELDAGLELLEAALTVARESGEDQHEALILNSIGALFLQKEDYSTALEYLHQALVRLRHLGIRTAEAEALMTIGMAMHGSGACEAETWLRQALDLYQETNDPAGEAAVLKLLGEPGR